ncbi:MAG TPA: nitronate monooxygenase [Pseudonocardiaceae bacterium]|jgi:nitronate monooxygenase|nr:nitronate monooxygenase [Pseudonocardiaceae bacterium]
MLSALRIPVIAAPMAGGPSTPELVAAVSGTGGFGFLAAGYKTVDALAAQITATRALTTASFGVNVFVPGPESTVDVSGYRLRVQSDARRYGVEPGDPHWDDDGYQAKIDLLVATAVPVVSFTFGLPESADVHRLHEAGAEVVVTVTTPDEARRAAESGADSLCVQGFEAGGHRGTFVDDPLSPTGGEPYGLLALLRLVSAAVDLPLVAAGGIVHGRDVAAALAGGAAAVQCGTAFLRCPEAGTPATQRAALAEGTRTTTVTRAFSGRPARGLTNQFIAAHDKEAPAAYPQLHHMTRPVRGAAAAANDPESMSLWAGQTYALATEEPAADVVHRLHAEAGAALAAAVGAFSGGASA